MGMGPHTPLPPALIFAASLAGAEPSPAYFFATSWYAGPTSLVLSAWQALQLYFAASAAPSASAAFAMSGWKATMQAVAADRMASFMESPFRGRGEGSGR